MFNLLKDTQNSPSPWFNVVPSLKKLCQTVVARYDQANLQPALNKGAVGPSLTIFVTNCGYQTSAQTINFGFLDKVCLNKVFLFLI